jgi:hypothetical protein
MKCYLQCKVDGECLQVSKKQLQWLIEHATDHNVTEMYDIIILNGKNTVKVETSRGLETVLKILQH